MSRRLLPLIPAGLSVVQVLPAPDRVTIVTVPLSSESACPLCGGVSGQVHSHYTRTLADLPWQGRVAAVQVRVRRFRCIHPECPRRIFTERLPEIARPRTRRTVRLGDVQRHIGLALGGAPGSRLAARLAMPISADTLLRMIRSSTLVPSPPPRVIGVDDWALRRGHRYGTIICDLERRRVVDLLPDRSADTLASWLKVASEPEVLVRFFRESGLTYTRIGLEAGPLSQWLHAGLTAAGFEVVLLETRHEARLNDIELCLRGILRGFGLKLGEIGKGRFEARVRELVLHRLWADGTEFRWSREAKASA